MAGPYPRTRPRGTARSGRARRRRRRLLVATVVLVAVAVGVAVSRRNSAPSAAPVCAVTPSGVTSSGTAAYSLSPDQAQNAAIIAAVAHRQGLPDHAVTVALATALQESGLRDLPYGDRDSVGLFQQRPSQGWGTRAQLLDPVYASVAFYSALTKVAGWQTMAVTDAAQAVQQSAAPSAYSQWESQSRALAEALTGEIPAGLTCRFGGFAGAPPAPGALGQAMSLEMGGDLIGATVPANTGWAEATWIVAHAYSYHVRTVTFGAWSWSPSGGWRQRGHAPATAVTVGY